MDLLYGYLGRTACTRRDLLGKARTFSDEVTILARTDLGNGHSRYWSIENDPLLRRYEKVLAETHKHFQEGR